MKVLGLLKKFFNITFALYTCMAFAIMVFYRSFDVYGGISWVWSDIEMMFGNILLFAAYSGFIIALTDAFSKLPAALRYVIKLVLVYVGYYVWMKKSVPGVTSSQILIMTTLYVVVFAVIALAGTLLALAEKKLTVKEQDYKEVFGDDKKEDKKDGSK